MNLDGRPIRFEVLKSMAHAQVHRGPDDQGFVGISTSRITPISGASCVEANMFAGVGFNRLSIQDLSMNGHQPMVSVCGRYVIAYNGEVYNCGTLRGELMAKGHRFRGNSDTEVVLNLFIEYGLEKCLRLLNGMFSFFLYDLISATGFLARDHFGIKPLYYYKQGDLLLFSSELKSFHSHPEYSAKIDGESLDEYLIFRSCAHDRTLVQGVKQVPPGNYVSIRGRDVTQHSYWSLSYPDTEDSRSIVELDRELDVLLGEVVGSQLISDVKVGCQLSGGVDSSLVTTYAREYFDANMDTFSIVFNDEKYSEEKWINFITNHTQSDSHRFYLSDEYFARNFMRATWHLDQPISIPNALGIMRLAEGAVNNVKVLLSGEGADEVFGGYARYHDLSMRMLIGRFPGSGLVSRATDKKFKHSLTESEFFIMSSSAISRESFGDVRGESGFDAAVAKRTSLYPSGNDSIKNACIYDMRTHLVDLLNRQDKMTMASSVENRVPFLDRRVVEYAMGLPRGATVSRPVNPLQLGSAERHTKKMLKEIARQRFGSDFVYRRKSGFPVPEVKIFGNSQMIELVNDMLMPGIKVRGLLRYETIKALWDKVDRTKAEAKNLWMAIALEAWAQQFLVR